MRRSVAGSLRKTALQEAAQPLCNASMTLPDAGGYYTAWSTMSTLVKRKLVLREGNPARSVFFVIAWSVVIGFQIFTVANS